MEILVISFFGKTIGSSCQLVEDKAMLKSNLSAQLVSAEGNGEHRKMLPFPILISLQVEPKRKTSGALGAEPPSLKHIKSVFKLNSKL